MNRRSHVLKKPDTLVPVLPKPEVVAPVLVADPMPVFGFPEFQKPVFTLPGFPTKVFALPELFIPVWPGLRTRVGGPSQAAAASIIGPEPAPEYISNELISGGNTMKLNRTVLLSLSEADRLENRPNAMKTMVASDWNE